MIDGVVYDVAVESASVARLRGAVKRHHRTAPQTITAPMPGRVLAVEVAVGDAVTAGQGVVIIEAMKMENELRAHADGRVKEVRVQPGDAVNKGDVLVVLER
ncbi:MAG: biotin/lipoyl-binding protein [Candidatus Latescibacteria bacterium]|nr:biotin/lipoyl-binding protein [Candidatus Latescibacterota bacterium]